MKHYRQAIDDGIYFLRDIATQKYRSLFDCPFLAALHGVHREYQTRFVINVFLETHEGDFSLVRMPADYRGEWADNAHWLRLAFHARQEFPDKPYATAAAATVLRDYDDIAQEVLRFAGEPTWSPTTVIHWATTRADILPALATRGVRALSGLFYRDAQGGWDLNYGLNAELSAAIFNDGYGTDPNSGIYVSRFDIVLNNTPAEKIRPTLEHAAANSAAGHVIDLLTHEQYSWPFYKRFVPDHTERIATAARWCTERGLTPVFLQETVPSGSR